MKKFFTCLSVVAVFLFADMTCSVAQEQYSIQELPNVTTTTWQQSYQAYGRTIEVNERIIIPEVSSAPVLKVQVMPPIDEPLYSELTQKYDQAAKDDPTTYNSFTSTALATHITHSCPILWDESEGYSVFKIGQENHALFEYDMNTAYADANSLALADAFQTAIAGLREAFPNADLYLRNVALYDRTYWKSNNEKISEKGNYFLELTQVFHGIPFIASVHNLYRDTIGNESGLLEAQGLVRAEVWDTESYDLTSRLYEEIGVLYEDIPLIPFDSVKPQVEELILNGYIRFIDSVTLGYVQFDTSDEEEFVLMPAWVVWCEYDNNGPRHERDVPLYMDSFFMSNEYYWPIIFNGQTGEMLNPKNSDINRCQYPSIITW